MNIHNRVAQFWARVEKTDGCWIWKGPGMGKGYGKAFGRYAHRVSYEYANGSIPSGLFVLHRCDVRLCVNPRHLFVGTQSDNIQDMLRKGRGSNGDVRGERNGRAKLTDQDIPQIRAAFDSGESCESIAARYPVSAQMIKFIGLRRSWSHIS